MTHALFLDAMCVPRVEHLVCPATNRELAESLIVADAVRSMRDVSARLTSMENSPDPFIWFAFRGRYEPQPFWVRHLWIQINLTNGEGWRGWLSHIFLDRQELLIEPRQDKTHPHLARHAVSQSNPRISNIKIGVPHQQLVRFNFLPSECRWE